MCWSFSTLGLLHSKLRKSVAVDLHWSYFQIAVSPWNFLLSFSLFPDTLYAAGDFDLRLQAKAFPMSVFSCSRVPTFSLSWMISLKTADSVLPAGAPCHLLPAFSHLADSALSFFLKNSSLFVWLCWVSFAAWEIFSCGIQTPSCSRRDLVPQLGIKPRPTALGVWRLSHWTVRKVPDLPF